MTRRIKYIIRIIYILEKDDTYFKLAEKYLYNELSISLNMSIEEVKNYIFKIVNKQSKNDDH